MKQFPQMCPMKRLLASLFYLLGGVLKNKEPPCQQYLVRESAGPTRISHSYKYHICVAGWLDFYVIACSKRVIQLCWIMYQLTLHGGIKNLNLPSTWGTLFKIVALSYIHKNRTTSPGPTPLHINKRK